MSAHVVKGARGGFGKRGKCRKFGKRQNFRNLWGNIRVVLALSRGICNDFPASALMGIFPECQFGALSGEKDTYFWEIQAGVHPCLHMSSRAAGGVFRKRGKFGKRRRCGKCRNFRNPGEILRGVTQLFRVVFNDPPPQIRNEYSQQFSSVRYRMEKGYIALANPGAYTSMSAHVVGGARGGFRERGKCGKFQNFRNFRRDH